MNEIETTETEMTTLNFTLKVAVPAEYAATATALEIETLIEKMIANNSPISETGATWSAIAAIQAA